MLFFFMVIYAVGYNDSLYRRRSGGIEDYGQTFFTMLVLVADLRAGITVTYYMVLFIAALVLELVMIPVA